jgi:hypothetical protein
VNDKSAACQDVYSPIKYTPAGDLSFVSPLYVGLLAWSELVANHSTWLGAAVTASSPMKNTWAHATLSSDSANGGGARTTANCKVVRVLVIAKDEPRAAATAAATPSTAMITGGGDIAVTVSVPSLVLPQPSTNATLLYLTAPALSSRVDVDWAGQSWGGRHGISADGRPIGARTAGVVVARAPGEYAFTLPQLSAAILVVQDCSGGA